MSTKLHATALCLVVALSSVLALPTRAQELTGRVLDGTTREPVPGAVLALLHPDGYMVGDSVMASDSGAFRLAVPGVGSYYIRVERPRYTGIVDGVFDFESTEASLEVTIYLVPEPIELEGIEANVEQTRIRRSLRANGYYERVATGFGDFVSPAEIEARRGSISSFSELLRSIPGFTSYQSLLLYRNRSASGQLVRVNDGGGFEPLGMCEPNVWLDGTLLSKASGPASELPPELRRSVGPGARILRDRDVEQGIDGYLNPEDVVAVEVYRRGSSTPLQWSTPGGSCSTIVIWTRQGR